MQKEVINVIDEMSIVKCKLKFLSESIVVWDENTRNLDSDFRYGFGLLMDDLVNEIDKNMGILDKTIKKE